MMRTWLRLLRLPRRLVVAAALRLLKLLKLLQLRLQQRKQLQKKLRQNNNVEYISTIALFPVREKALFYIIIFSIMKRLCRTNGACAILYQLARFLIFPDESEKQGAGP